MFRKLSRCYKALQSALAKQRQERMYAGELVLRPWEPSALILLVYIFVFIRSSPRSPY
ncbi:hypothetical protein IQ07DRAFT_592274 [Pyrenochaeta sp. DS3sAY3a]|nr:hypothetical protein IQ07DRAFT_592274 [Pyrenochaeta sp. DS3sAY3a]